MADSVRPKSLQIGYTESSILRIDKTIIINYCIGLCTELVTYIPPKSDELSYIP